MKRKFFKYFTLLLAMSLVIAGITQNQFGDKSFAKNAKTKTTQNKNTHKKPLTLNEIIHNGKPTIIQFTSQFCYDCQTVKPFIEKLKEQYDKKINFIIIDIKDNKPLTTAALEKYNVVGVPYTIYLNKKGNKVKDLGGARSEASYKKQAEELLKK